MMMVTVMGEDGSVGLAFNQSLAAFLASPPTLFRFYLEIILN